MRAVVLAGLAACALSGCGFVPFVQAHAPAFAAIGLVAGTLTTVEQAVVNADEVVERTRRHVEKESAPK